MLVNVVMCKQCVLHDNCIIEDSFKLAGIENPFCCVGFQKESSNNSVGRTYDRSGDDAEASALDGEVYADQDDGPEWKKLMMQKFVGRR